MPADSAPVDESQEQMPRIVASIDAAGNPGVDLQGFRRQYDQGTLMFLRMTSRTLNSARLGQGDVSASIDAIRTAAEDLRKRIVEDTEIDATVRRLLFELVDQILRALDLIKIGGVDVVLAEFDRFTGRYVREPWLQRTIRQHPKVFSTLTQLATAVNAIASLINAGAALDNTLDSLFTGEPSPALAPAAGHDADTA
jgi:glutamine synthetase adenylyltransferase